MVRGELAVRGAGGLHRCALGVVSVAVLVAVWGCVGARGAFAPAQVPLAPLDRCQAGTWRNANERVAPWVQGCPGFSLVAPGWVARGDGTRALCPAGRFSAAPGATECLPCTAGHWCGAGSVSAREHACGGASFFCGEGSARPTPAQEGYFTFGGDASGGRGAIVDGEWLGDAETRRAQRLCPRGMLCSGGEAHVCPPGHFCASEGLSTPSGVCEAGYYCPAGSTSARERMCAGAMTSVTTMGASIGVGMYDLALAGGVEHMGHHPIGANADPNPRFVAGRILGLIPH